VKKEIRLRTYSQLDFMKKINLDKTFIRMIDRVITDLQAIERHLEGVMQLFLQFYKEYLVFSPGVNSMELCQKQMIYRY
jgi:hypothetical protein